MKHLVDRFENWLQATSSYLQVRAVLRRCPAAVQQFVKDLEEESLKPSGASDERDRACAAIAAALLAHAAEGVGSALVPPTPRNAKLLAFAERLKALRHQKGMTQEELAQRVGLRQSAISMMENGQCRPQPSTLTKLANQLGVPGQELWPKTSVAQTTEEKNGRV